MEKLLTKEWLLTNSRGGFCSSTAAGVNTRKYHGLLTGALNPPANRIMSLNCCLEKITSDHGVFDLSSFEFDTCFGGGGHQLLERFTKNESVNYHYNLNWVDITKSVLLFPDRDVVALVYDFSNLFGEFDFTVRPLTAMRDFHALQNSSAMMSSEWRNDGLAVTGPDLNCGELFMSTLQMWFENDPQWWYGFKYRKEQQRGQGFMEDLWSPGIFKCHIENDCKIILYAGLGEHGKAHQLVDFEPFTALTELEKKLKQNNSQVKNDPVMNTLYKAAGQFVIDRKVDGKPISTILAGFPWFMDWGRDAFISLPGLLLCTGRHKKAADVLTAFADGVSEGMIPNRYDDYNSSAHYNSIDASLWFVNAAFEYFHETGDFETFDKRLIQAIRYILEMYQKSTRFGIHADTDGLITGGDENTQLTWMDAKCGGTVFTPRHGKAVEINALWYSALCSIAEYYRDSDDKQHANWMDAEYYGSQAQLVSESFVKLFWNEDTGYLNDCVLPDGTVDTSLRPNQIYAVALPYSPLSDSQQKSVVDTVEKHLLTDYGLRTLNHQDSRYCPRYEGDQYHRDGAYHQGTVWPHLIGPFIEAYLLVHGLEKQNLKKCHQFLQPLLNHLNEDACIGSISEIFDAEAPHKPKGCFAQAWAVAEVLRSYKIVTGKI